MSRSPCPCPLVPVPLLYTAVFKIAYNSLAQATVTRVEGPPVFLAVLFRERDN